MTTTAEIKINELATPKNVCPKCKCLFNEKHICEIEEKINDHYSGN